MELLLELLESATNVKSLHYDKDKNEWRIEYYNGEPNEMPSEILLDFLENA